MVSNISHYDNSHNLEFLRGKAIIEEQSRLSESLVAALVVPLILCNHDQIQSGQCKKLHFAQPSQLSKGEICGLNGKAFHCAKLIIHDGEHTIKVDNKVKDLDFDEIAFEYMHDGKKVEKTMKKGEKSVEEMDEEEISEIRGIVAKTLFIDRQPDVSDSESASTDEVVEDSKHSYSYRERVSPKLSNLAIAIAINAALNAQRREREERDQQRRLDEKAMIVRDTEKRREKMKEARWKAKQKHFQILDRNRSQRLEEVRESENFEFESRKRRMISAEA